jgi:hypothetical protein
MMDTVVNHMPSNALQGQGVDVDRLLSKLQPWEELPHD